MIGLRNLVVEVENSYLLLIFFLIPFILSILMSFVSFTLFAYGFLIMGFLAYLVKILVTVPAFIIFKVKKEELLKFKILNFANDFFEVILSLEIVLKMEKKVQNFKNELIDFFYRLKKEGHKGFIEEMSITLKKIKRILLYTEVSSQS